MKKVYSSLSAYMSYLETVSSVSNKFLPGNFYSYEYHFNRVAKDFEVQRFYDKRPLIFLISEGPTMGTFIGLNLHQIPVKSRLIWLTRFNKISGILDENVRAVYCYEVIKAMFKKARYGIRVYKADRIFKLRKVDSTKMYDLSKYYSNTYYGATIDVIEVRYENF